MPLINGEQVYEAEVKEVHSGDDLMLMVNLGIDGLYKRVRGRLSGVDTPDAYKADRDSEAGKVRQTVRELVNNKRCRIVVQDQNRSSWKVTLFIMEGSDPSKYVNLNEQLMGMGYIFKSKSEYLK